MGNAEKPKEVSESGKASKQGVSVLVLLLLTLITVIILAGWWAYKNYNNKKETTAKVPLAGRPIPHIDQPKLAITPCDCGERKSTQKHAGVENGEATTTQEAKPATVVASKPVIDVTPATPVTKEAPPSTSAQSATVGYKLVLDVVDDNYGKPQVESVPLDRESTTSEIIVVETEGGWYDRDTRYRYDQPVYDVPAYVPGSVLLGQQVSVQQSPRPVYDVPAYVPGSVLAQQPRYVPPSNGGPNGGGGAHGPVNPAP